MAGVFICILVWIIYGVAKAINDGNDATLTKEYKHYAQQRSESTYYDYKAGCTRYIGTGEKCTQLYGIDTEGHRYTYVATKPLVGPQKIHDIKYCDPRHGDKVKVDPETMARWKRNGQI